MKKIAPYAKYGAKALVAGGVTFCGGLAVALADQAVTGVEWCGIVSTTLVAVGAVFGITNGPKP